MKTIGELAPTLFADRQGRSGLMAPWANGKNGKEYRATMGKKAIVGIFSMGLEEKYRWKDSVQNGDEIRLWVADGIAHDLRPWFTKFDAKLIDRRWLPVIEDIYKWHFANEPYLRNESSLARVGMVYSQQTATFYGGEEAHAKVEDASLGFYEALVEARIPFQMVHDRMLDREHIDQYRTLILPNIAALSTAQCQQIREFVERGGSVVATYEASMYDEVGCPPGRPGPRVTFWSCDRRQQRRPHAQLVFEPGKGRAYRKVSSSAHWIRGRDEDHQRGESACGQEDWDGCFLAFAGDSNVSRSPDGRGLPASSQRPSKWSVFERDGSRPRGVFSSRH